MFNLEYIAASLGVNIDAGGLSVVEEQLVVPEENGKVTVTQAPVAFAGSKIGWYRKATETDWKIGKITGKDMSIPSAKNGEIYCVKYFYQNENARSVTIKTQYTPSELHVVIMNDLFSGDINSGANADKYGRLITDIPRLQLEGNQELTLNSTSAASVSLSGSALAVTSLDSCEEDPYYGTMTEEVYGGSWKDNVVAIAVENGDVKLGQRETEELSVRVIYNGSMTAQRKDNSNFTFAVEAQPASTASGTKVDAHTGVITAGSAPGNCVVSVTLEDAPEVEPAFVLVTVAG